MLERQVKDGCEIINLDSTNGTWLNELRLVPNKPYPLTSGAQIRLGRMHLFTIYRDVVSKK
jgi:pSer/pThr/pTyr-binding forkhead associated (FHA) protein